MVNQSIIEMKKLLNPFVLKLQTRLADTDNLGHLNNVAYIEFLETARTEWFASVTGDRRSLDSSGWEWILGAIEIKFVKEACLSDILSVYMWCSRIGTKSWDFSYAIINQKNELIAQAKTSQVGFDYETKASMFISTRILDDLNSRSGKPWT
ncbi:MAG: acyl-CoA thioesterase [Candidatus Kariarchaeaceae archaeon]|jgi:YbgC/YbaW family acyl-CoA thioester hydrolase